MKVPLRVCAAAAGAALLGAAGSVAGAGSTTARGGERSAACGLDVTPRVALRVSLPGVPRDLAQTKTTLWVALAGRHDPRTGAILGRGAIAAVDKRTGRLLRLLRPPIDPTEVAVGFGSLWVIGSPIRHGPRGVLRVDPRSGRVVAAIRAARAYGSRIAATTRAVWVGGADVYPKGHSERAGVRFVYRIDPRRNAVVRRVHLPGGMTVLDLDGEGANLWVSGWWGVAELSASGRVLFHAAYRGAGWSMARTRRAVWISLPWSGTPYERRQDPAHRAQELLRIGTGSRRSRPQAIDLPSPPGGVEAAGGTVWMGGGELLARVDDSTSPPAVVPIEGLALRPTAMEGSPGSLWVSELTRRRLTKLVC